MSGPPLYVGPMLHLRTVPAFRELSSVELTALAQHVEEVVAPRGSLVLSAGTPVDAFHMIVDGRVDVVEPSGVHHSRGPGDTVGFTEMLARRPARLESRAESDVISLRLAEDAFRDVSERHFGMTHSLLSHAASRVATKPGARALAERGDPAGPALPVEATLDRVDRIIALHRAPAFPSTVMDALAELAGHLTPLRLESGAALWVAGAPAEEFVLLCSGRVENGGEDGGEPIIVGPGGMPGLVDAMRGAPRTTGAVAVEDAVALRVDLETLLDVLEDHFDMSSGILAFLATCLLDASGLRRAE